jgi:hypothetical protein
MELGREITVLKASAMSGEGAADIWGEKLYQLSYLNYLNFYIL